MAKKKEINDVNVVAQARQVERHNERLSKDYRPTSKFVVRRKVVINTKYVGKDGLVYDRSEIKTESPADKFRGFKFYDFGVEQLSLAGATNMLSSVSTLSNINGASMADYADRQMDKIENSLNNMNNNNN